MGTLHEQLDAMLALPENWDGYGADSILPSAVATAKDFVSFFEAIERANGQTLQLIVGPTRIGGVQVEWQDHREDHELEVMPDGSLSILHFDRVEGRTREEQFAPPTERAVAARGLIPRMAEWTAFAGAR